MGDQNHGFILTLRLQGVQNDRLIQAVQIGGGFVQQQEGGIVQEGSGQSQPLPFAAGEGIAQLADLGVIALG